MMKEFLDHEESKRKLKLVLLHIQYEEVLRAGIVLGKINKQDFNTNSILAKILSDDEINSLSYDDSLLFQRLIDRVNKIIDKKPFEIIAKDLYFEKITKIFLFDGYRVKGRLRFKIEKYIEDTFDIFLNVISVQEPSDITNKCKIVFKDNYKKQTEKNILLIIKLILEGKIKSGKNITKLLMKKETNNAFLLCKPFMGLCSERRGKYYLNNFNINDKSFIYALYDCITFALDEHKFSFDAKLYSYTNSL